MPIRRNLHIRFKLLPVYHFNCNCKTLSPRQMPKSLTVSQGPRFWTFCARQWVVAWWDRQVDKELLNTMFQINFSEQEMSWCVLLSFASCEPAALTLPKVMCSSIAKVISRLLCRTAFGRLCWPWLTWERCSRIVSRPPKRADGSLGAPSFHMFPLRIRCSTDSTAINYICGSGVQDKLLLSGLRRLEMQTVVRMLDQSPVAKLIRKAAMTCLWRKGTVNFYEFLCFSLTSICILHHSVQHKLAGGGEASMSLSLGLFAPRQQSFLGWADTASACHVG